MRTFCRWMVLCVLLSASIFPGFQFSSQNSQIRLKPNAQLINNAGIVGWSGKLIHETGSSVPGTPIVFDGGRVEDFEEPDTFIEGDFEQLFNDPVYGNAILMTGGQKIEIEGNISQNIVVQGVGNRIVGSPNFLGTITLEDNTAELRLGISTAFSGTIDFNDGKLTLDDGLVLSNDAVLNGPANIQCNGYQLDVPGGNWHDSLRFIGPSIINMRSQIILETFWYFEGTHVFNGGGSIIDLTNPAARLKIEAGADVTFNNVYLNGITNDNLEFSDTAAQIRVADCSLSITGDTNTELGKIYIDATTTFLLREHDWIFTNESQVITESGLLWVDVSNRIEEPLFGEVDLFGSFISYINGTTVKQLVDRGQVDSGSLRLLLSGAVSTTILLDESALLDPDNQINFVGDSLVSAGGSGLTFAAAEIAQVVVPTGLTATFDDIQLLRVFHNTFDIQPGGTLNFEKDVKLEFSENLTFSYGTLQIIGANNVASLRGIGGRKLLTLEGSDSGLTPAFNLGANTLALEDIELFGLEFFTSSERFVAGEIIEGGIALVGGSVVNMSGDSDVNLFIEGRDNEMWILKNDLHFDGKITFGDEADNELLIRFALTEEVDKFRIYLGDFAISLESEVGRAGVTFDDFDVTVVCKSASSIVAGQHSYFGGEKITIESNPISQKDSDFSLQSGLVLQSDLPNPIEPDFIRSESKIQRPGPPRVNALKLKNRKRGLKKHSKVAIQSDNYFKSAKARALKVPRPHLRIKKRLQLGAAKGVIRLEDGGGLTKFNPDIAEQLSLELSGGARVYTKARRTRRVRRPVRAGEDDTDKEVFKDDDVIYISGVDNRIIVTGDVLIKGQLVFDDEAELIFEFDDSLDSDKSVFIGSTDFLPDGANYTIEMPQSSSLVFNGSGNVRFLEGTVINCDGSDPATVATGGELTFDDDRPSVIFKNFAQFVVDSSAPLLTMQGKGRLVFHDSSQAYIIGGQVILGTSDQDFFDFTVDRNALFRVGNFGELATDDVIGRVSLAQGLFNVSLKRAGTLSVREGGVFEAGLLNGTFLGGEFDQFDFATDSLLDVSHSGLLALGQSDLSSTTPFLWNNLEGKVEGDGSAGLFVAGSTDPLFSGQIQTHLFESVTGSAFDVVKGLVTRTAGLIDAVDFIDSSGQYSILTAQNQIVALENDDVVLREDEDDGFVYGIKASGVEFRVSPAGVLQFRS